MVAICPCCHQTVAANDLLVSVDANRATRAEKSVHLTTHEAKVLYELKASAPKASSHERLAIAIYGYNDGPQDVSRAIYVLISRLRTKVWNLGVRITSIPEVGYRIELV